MSLAIKFGDSSDQNSISGAIYFDAVTSYKKDFSGKVTEHPIELGAKVSDHYVSNNPKYKISGVISHVDLSPISSMVILEGEPVLNANMQPQAVMVENLGSTLREFIPDSIAQFLPNISAGAIMDQAERVNHRDSISLLLKELLNGIYYNEDRKKWENRMTTTTLYEMDGISPKNPIQDLIVTNCSINESVDTGDALVLELSLEQVRFVTLEKAEAPKPAKGTQKGAAETKNKGNAPSTPRSAEQEKPTVIGNIKAATKK